MKKIYLVKWMYQGRVCSDYCKAWSALSAIDTIGGMLLPECHMLGAEEVPWDGQYAGIVAF